MILKRLTLAFVLSLLTLQGCSTSPLGRSQLLMQNEASLAASAQQEYQKMKNEVPISKDKALTAYVNCVVAPLTKEVVGDNWEVTLFESDQVNAFALPGGKIGVYTGILKFANNPIVSALERFTAQYRSGNFSPLSTFIIPFCSGSKDAQRLESRPANLDHAR